MLKSVTVSFIPLRHCLVNLPKAWANALLDQGKLSQNVVLELSWQIESGTTRKAYVGWSGGASESGSSGTDAPAPRPGFVGDVIEIDPQFGASIGLRSGQNISIDFVKSIQDGVSVNVAPYSEDDWEILELHAGYVEDQMLNQIRILYPHEIFTVWVNGRTLVRLRVLDINPAGPCVKLGANAEIIVAPMVRKVNGGASKSTPPPQDLAHSLQKVVQSQCLRLLSVDELDPTTSKLDIDDFGPFTVQVHPESWQEASLAKEKILRIHKVAPPHAEQSTEDEIKDAEDLFVGANSIYAKVVTSHKVPLGHVAVTRYTQDALDAENFSILRLVQPKLAATNLASISLRPISSNSTTPAPAAPMKLQPNSANHRGADAQSQQAAVVNSFKEWVHTIEDNQDVVLTHGTLLKIPGSTSELNQSFSVNFPTKSLPAPASADTNIQTIEAFTVFSKQQLLTHIEVDVGQPQGVYYVYKKTSTHSSSAEAPAALGGVTEICTKAEKYLTTTLAKLELRKAFSVPGTGGLLLCGPHGSGKTVVARYLTQKMANQRDTLAHTVEINCSEYTEDRLPVLMTKFQQWFDTAAFHSPSILYLEDLDRLIPAEVEHADSFRSRQIAEVFLQIATRMTRRFEQIAVVATCQQQASVHQSLVTSHLFSEIIRLIPPGKTERKEMLQVMMEFGPPILKRSLPQIDLVSVASKTEGYLAADLKAFIERTIHEGAVRNIAVQLENSQKEEAENTNGKSASNATAVVKGKSGIVSASSTTSSSNTKSGDNNDFVLVQADFLKAQEGFVPSSLRGVKLQSSATSWLDIGGLNETRKTLLETLEWPTKYASIFSQCPLRLRSGLLLFGHPGCGKTLLASAVAKECGLNFISVKGPELLNKYIGASEKSVRDLFERAQAAKPCVLFFDEFDSIAPKRGHDSTGVTDRVVNQMLTQMDGAEGLDGVYVLAATSRPDLIDPALLRPGRLDKSLLCGMPTLEDRYEILVCLSRKMEVDEATVDLREVARRTEGLTGADLQAVLYNAHLEAIRVAIEKDEAIKKEKKSQEGSDSSSSSSRADNGLVRFVSMGGKGFGAGKGGKAANLTLAERGHISQRLGLITKGLQASTAATVAAAAAKAAASSKSGSNETEENTEKSTGASRPIITAEHLEVSLKSTRSSITPEESLRLDLIYKEFLGDRTGEMSNGTGSHELGQRTTLA